MRPAGMLSHRRCDGNTFCNYQRDRVDCNGNGSWIEARRRILVKRRGVEVVFMTRHGDGLYGNVRTTRQRRGGRDVYAGCSGGDIATCPVQKAQNEASIVRSTVACGIERRIRDREWQVPELNTSSKVVGFNVSEHG